RRRPISSTQPISMIRCPSVTGMPVVSVSSTTLRMLFLSTPVLLFGQDHATVGQLIGSLIAWMPGMATHPLPGHLVSVDLLIELLPQICILDRLLGRSFPAPLFPVRHPVLNALHDVLRVSYQAHRTGALEFGQRTNRR